MPFVTSRRYDWGIKFMAPTKKQRKALDQARKELHEAFMAEDENRISAAYLTINKIMDELGIADRREEKKSFDHG